MITSQYLIKPSGLEVYLSGLMGHYIGRKSLPAVWGFYCEKQMQEEAVLFLCRCILTMLKRDWAVLLKVQTELRMSRPRQRGSQVRLTASSATSRGCVDSSPTDGSRVLATDG